MSFIEDLLLEMQTKEASDKGEKEDKKEDRKEDKKDDKKDDKHLPPWLKKKEDEKDGKEEEKRSSQLFAELTAMHPELKKFAADEAASLIVANLSHQRAFSSTKEAAMSPEMEAAIFNTEFQAHTEKLAAQDPEYAAIIEDAQIKQAFDDGCREELLAIKQANNIDDETFSNVLSHLGVC